MFSQEITLASANLNLQAQAWGNPEKTPILALHGWLDNSSSFEPLGKLLSEYYVLAPDLIGHARSNHLPINVTYTLEMHVLTLLCALDGLGWKKFSILGHSLGAGIGVALASVIPDRVTRVITLDKLGPPVLPVDGYLEQFLLNMQSRISQKHRRAIVYKTLTEAIDIRCHMSGCSEKTAQLITDRDLIPVTDGFISQTDRRLQFKSHRSITEEQCQSMLRSVKCPTFLIRSESGMLKGRDLSQRENCLSHLKIVDVPGVHHVHIEEPTMIASLISKFVPASQ